jgi:hypothetical protein
VVWCLVEEWRALARTPDCPGVVLTSPPLALDAVLLQDELALLVLLRRLVGLLLPTNGTRGQLRSVYVLRYIRHTRYTCHMFKGRSIALRKESLGEDR